MGANLGGHIGPQSGCHSLANKIKLAHSSLKALVLEALAWPILCPVIFGLLARIGPL